MENETQTTLRDDISNAVKTVQEAAPEPVSVVDATPVVEKVAAATTATETAEQRTERLRDEAGRFAKNEKPTEPVAATTPVQRPQRPSSWKKEYWDHWEKIDPALATYLNEREQQFATGVSTYKREWDTVKPVLDAVTRFNPQEYGMNPIQFITGLGEAHQVLAKGSPEQKLSAFLKLANDYEVPVQQLFTQGEDGKVYFNPQVQSFQQKQPDVGQLVQEKFEEYTTRQQVEQFAKSGKPHFDRLREPMAGLLRAGLANDLDDAYDKATKLDPSVYQEIQKQDEDRKREEAAKVAQAARAKAVSVKSSTPAGNNAGGGKEIRDELREAIRKHSGRV